MKFNAKVPNKLIGQINHKQTGHVYLEKHLGKLPQTPRRSASSDSNNINSRVDLFFLAGLPTNHTTRYWNIRNSKIEINVPDGAKPQAEFFFSELFNQAHTRAKSGKDGNDKPLSKAWVEKVAQDAKEKYDREQDRKLVEEVKNDITVDEDAYKPKAIRFQYNGASEKLLALFGENSTARDWAIARFDLSDPSPFERKKLENKYGIKKTTAFDVNQDKKALYFSASESNQYLANAFFSEIEEWLESNDIHQTNWEDVFEGHYEKAAAFVQKAQRSRISKLYETKDKTSRNPYEYIALNWNDALTEKQNGKTKNFDIQKDGQHYVLYANTTHATCLLKGLEPFQDYFQLLTGDNSFKIQQESKDRQNRYAVRLSSKVHLADAKRQFLKMSMESWIQNRPDVLSRARIKSEFNSNINKTAEALEARKEKRQQLAAQATQQAEKAQEKRITFKNKDERKVLQSLASRADDFKDVFDIKAMRITDQCIFIGGNKDEMTGKETQMKGFIGWLKDNASSVDVDSCEFRQEYTKYQSETREKRYETITIKGFDEPITMRNKEQIDLNERLDKCALNYVIGEAGTGKTFVVLAKALQEVYDSTSQIKRILIARPEIAVGGDKKAFLPGTVEEKLDPYLDGYKDNLYQIFKNDESAVERLMKGVKKGENGATRDEKPIIEIQDLGYIRGRTLNDYFIIVDECQNMTKEQDAVIPKRTGENSKMALLGDISGNQSDLPDQEKNAFRNRILEEAYLQSRNDIIPSKKGKNALDMIGITQLVEIERSEFVDNLIRIEKFREANGDIFTSQEFKSFEKNFVKRAQISLKHK